MHPTALLALLSLLLPGTTAHTWIEQLRLINPNGTFTPDVGYPRGLIPRSSPLFSDTVLTHLLPPNGRSPHKILPTDPMCMLTQSIPGINTPGLPRLQAEAGDHIALRYQENGHVTIPDTNPGKPKNRGTVYIYGTEKPLATDKFQSIHKVWTADGKGGDGRGVLLATRNYDDGQCYQVNDHPISVERQKQFPKEADAEMGVNLWCQSDIKLPANIDSNRYTLYWVWDWPTAAINGAPAMPETYTSCMDVDIASSSASGASAKLTSSKGAVEYVKGQDINNAGIKEEMENQFIVPVDGASADSNNGDSDAKSAEDTPSKPSVTQPAPVGGLTVTVTAPGSMTTVTVTASPSTSTQARSSVQSQQSYVSPTRHVPVVTPFLDPTPTSTTKRKMGTVTEVVEETVTVTQTMVMQMGGDHTAVPRIRGRMPRGY
ncbi:hypothetical protein V495_05144 [Pseudogymnoascus sp. VKM F-4514 (FW-929)]|nr:hypothetical protein V490_05636 [Pseudogymnoascus sp. VKM F-3557]KFY40958.1 hypothetical protein V495_05144 [Pseudogymnoascus sp. VKM F-4514 (FW-929)]KFY54496.1 hypothetical protein V497_07663 [Pseudogymnoascus sp. VKM F-4516 (FW-969)]